MSKAPWIGIDLGTTKICVSVYRNGKLEIIPSDLGEQSTPSYITFTNTKTFIGSSAKNQMKKNPNNSLFDLKRLIGHDFKMEELDKMKKYFPFELFVDYQTKKIQIEIEYNNNIKKKYFIEELLAYELQKIRLSASIYLGNEVKNVVIGVPNSFNLEQREIIKDAARISGFDFVEDIDESTLASFLIALNDPTKNKGETNNIIIDLGGGFFSISAITIEEGLFEVKASKGLSNLGGEDFDNRLIEYCATEFQKKNYIEVLKNPKALIRLKKECENAKKNLSSSQKTVIEVNEIINGKDLYIEITRDKFEQLCNDLFEKLIPALDELLKDAKLTKEKLNDIYLIGGSSRIPKIQTILAEYFKGKQLNKSLNPDESVSFGASIQSAIRSNIKDEKIEYLILLNVSPISLGMEIPGGEMNVIIPRNSTVPCKKTILVPTFEKNQTSMVIKIFEGENKLTKDNNLLGILNFDGIPKKGKGEVNLEITLDIDALFIIRLDVREKSINKNMNMVLTYDNYRLDKNYMNSLIFEYKKEFERNLDNSKIKSKIEEIFNWIIEHRDASNDDINSKKDELINLIEK